MKSITSLTPAMFQSFAMALPTLPGDSDFKFAVMSGKSSGLPHTLWVSQPCGATFKGLLDAVDGGDGSLSPNDRTLLKALWSDMTGLLPDRTRAGSFRISCNGKTGRVSFALNADVAPVEADDEEV
jgi:hypothetical protein